MIKIFQINFVNIFESFIKITTIFNILILSINSLNAEEKGISNNKQDRDVGCIVRTGLTAEFFSQNMAMEYMKIQPDALISVKTVGAGNVFKNVVEATADLGIVAGYGPNIELQKVLQKEKRNLIKKEIAIVGIRVITHKNNPIVNISKDKLIDIITGKINNWKDLSGQDKPINVYMPLPDEAFRAYVEKELLSETLKITNEQRSIRSNTVTKLMEDDQYGIGIVNMVLNTSSVKVMQIDGFEPTFENIKNKKYPLRFPLYVIYLESSSHTTQEFAKFITTRSINKKWLDALKMVNTEELEQ